MAVIADHIGLDSFGVAGVSGGGPYAFAAAALLPDRVTRCATIVTGPPLDAEGLDYFADVDPHGQEDWRKMIAGGEEYLLEDYQARLAWLDELGAEGPGRGSQEVHDMLVAGLVAKSPVIARSMLRSARVVPRTIPSWCSKVLTVCITPCGRQARLFPVDGRIGDGTGHWPL